MNKEKRIKLDTGIHQTLKGKVIDKYAFNKGLEDPEEQSHLIIKFTDGTFICIGVELDETDACGYLLDNKYCPELENYHSLPYYMDIKGNFHLEHYIIDRIKMNVIEPLPEERIEEIVKTEMEERRKKRYQKYLELKEEFEK